jgi:hypothetical protein
MTKKLPAKPDNNLVVRVQARPGETAPRTIARSYLDPLTLASGTLARLNNGNGGVDINAFIAELQNHASDASEGKLTRPEAMLTAQSHTLDALFHALITKSLANANEGYLSAAETYMRLAFKAQSQCRSTVETLAEMKNPAPFAFVRQANIANGPQQINNGIAVPHAREIENRQTKLLEASNGERLDTATASAASRTNQELETLDAVYRTSDASR